MLFCKIAVSEICKYMTNLISVHFLILLQLNKAQNGKSAL